MNVAVFVIETFCARARVLIFFCTLINRIAQ